MPNIATIEGAGRFIDPYGMPTQSIDVTSAQTPPVPGSDPYATPVRVGQMPFDVEAASKGGYQFVPNAQKYIAMHGKEWVNDYESARAAGADKSSAVALAMQNKQKREQLQMKLSADIYKAQIKQAATPGGKESKPDYQKFITELGRMTGPLKNSPIYDTQAKRHALARQYNIPDDELARIDPGSDKATVDRVRMQEFGMPAPGSGTDPRIQQALDAGFTIEQIRAHTGGR